MQLDDITRLFRTYWWMLVVGALVGGALGFGWATLQPKVYTASSMAIVTTGALASLDDAQTGDDFARSRVRSYLGIATSREVAAAAAEDAGLDISVADAVELVAVSNPEDTAILRVAADGSTPEEARDLAESWVAALADVIEEIESGGASGETVVQLRQFEQASLPTEPTSPNVRLMVGVGLVVGVFAGLGLALVRTTFDKRLRTGEDVDRSFTLPVLGVLPFDRNVAKRGVREAGKDVALAESMRQLRTNVQFINVDNPPRVVVMTSSLPGDGKSTTVIKLAEVMAQSGRPVVLIDADLRRPSIAKYLGLVEGVGLTDVLVGRASADDVMQQHTEIPKLRIMGAGAIPPNPSELLGSEAMRTLLYSFPPETLVLVDTAPLIPVTDGAVLSARTDGALVVVRAGVTTVDVLDKAMASLDRVGARAFGVILVGVARRGASSGGYHYAYGYESVEQRVRAQQEKSARKTPMARREEQWTPAIGPLPSAPLYSASIGDGGKGAGDGGAPADAAAAGAEGDLSASGAAASDDAPVEQSASTTNGRARKPRRSGRSSARSKPAVEEPETAAEDDSIPVEGITDVDRSPAEGGDAPDPTSGAEAREDSGATDEVDDEEWDAPLPVDLADDGTGDEDDEDESDDSDEDDDEDPGDDDDEDPGDDDDAPAARRPKGSRARRLVKATAGRRR